jgi:hypothetical protein
MISIRSHNVIDYVLGAAFLLSPYLFGFSGTFFAHDVFTALGIGLIGYSLLTDYRWSFTRAVPMGMHKSFDLLTGAFAILAPWIYGYRDLLTPLQSGVHWTLGLTIIAVTTLTERRPQAPSIQSPEVVVEEKTGEKSRRAA